MKWRTANNRKRAKTTAHVHYVYMRLEGDLWVGESRRIIFDDGGWQAAKAIFPRKTPSSGADNGRS